MTIFDSFILGAIQGLTEFLPISSSGHLVLMESWMKLDVESLKSFDIAVHVGTLLAIIVYFRTDIMTLWQAFWGFMAGKRGAKASKEMKDGQKLLGTLMLATIPAVIMTLLFEKWMDAHFRNQLSVAIMITTVGLLFFVVEWVAGKLKAKKLGLKEGVVIGLAQTLALIPGVSRSGITISAGLVQGVKREEAARFSFLLGGVAILAGACYAVLEIVKGKYAAPGLDVALVGIITSFGFGLAAISFLMQYLKRHTLSIFGVYRVILGLSILWLSFHY